MGNGWVCGEAMCKFEQKEAEDQVSSAEPFSEVGGVQEAVEKGEAGPVPSRKVGTRPLEALPGGCLVDVALCDDVTPRRQVIADGRLQVDAAAGAGVEAEMSPAVGDAFKGGNR